MKRRAFITLLGGAATWPLAARAEQPAKVPTIGVLGSDAIQTRCLNSSHFSEGMMHLFQASKNIASARVLVIMRSINSPRSGPSGATKE
jgi:hypothetical protein